MKIKAASLQVHAAWFTKCIQLYETYLVRHGIMIIGPSGGGKTAVFDILCHALTEMGTKHSIVRMNPKAITAPQMFGRLDPVSNDWTDGIFSVLWRKANKNRNQNTWIMLDGPVDAIWIENLNTVLDDNKLLTLANGDRIPMIPNVKLMFEAENLNNASPATVSRAGQIYCSSVTLGWKPVVQSWLASRRPQEAEILSGFFEKYVDNLLTFITKKARMLMQLPELNPVTTLMKMLRDTLAKSAEGKEILPSDYMERIFVFCCTWSFGGTLAAEDRPKFHQYLKSISSAGPDITDDTETVFEYYVDDVEPKWTHWRTRVPLWTYPTDADPKFSTLLIPTLDSVRYVYLCNRLLLGQKSPLLFIGGTGTTKTATVSQFLASLDSESNVIKTVPFSSATSPMIFQKAIEASVEKRQGRIFGPTGGKICVTFIDDLSMPEINEWGDQITNEIVRQLLAEEGFYSLDKPGEWKNIVDLRYISAMNMPGGGKNDVPNRLKRQYNVFSVLMPSLASIDNIYGSIVRGRYRKPLFSDGIVSVSTKLTDATISVWQKISVKMLPTPSKFHYMFNIRDIARVFQGMLQCPNAVMTNEEYLLALWKHETERVFCDKLITNEDKDWCVAAIAQVGEEIWGKQYAKELRTSSYFVDFLRDPKYDDEGNVIGEERPKVYELLPSLKVCRDRIEHFQKMYNDEHKVGKLDLVIFDDAMKHVMRISRILGMDRGSALLVGVGGSGKQSLTRLASFIAGNYTFQITITKHYNMTNLFEDLKSLYKVAGFQGRSVTFIFTDAEVKDEGFLEYINQILSTGEVANLFAKDEIDAILNDIRNVAKKAIPGFLDSIDNLYKFFMDRVRDNLHVILCFSPVGDKLATRARKFPALINGCTIDWFLAWPEDALMAVADKFIGEFQMETTAETKSNLIKHMGVVHRLIGDSTTEYFQTFRRYVYTTPKSYLSFINNYKTEYKKQHGHVHSLADQINVGLRKLAEAESDIAKMKIELQSKEKVLAEAQRVSNELLKEITASTAKAEKKKNEVQQTKDVLSAQAAVINKEKTDVERDLEAAKPALAAAEDALKSINAKDIQGLKALKNPPTIIKLVFDGVLILKQRPVVKCQMVDDKGKPMLKDSYPTALQMMGDVNFLSTLVNFPKDCINDETTELLYPYTEREEFTVESARKASGMAAGLCQWVRSMTVYQKVVKEVIPKMDALRKAERAVEIANAKLQAAVDELNQCQAELDEMQRKFDAALAEKQRLQDELMLTKKRMDAANALISGLGGEKERWTMQSKEFADQISRLVGDAALACAFLSYLGPFNKEFREKLMKERLFLDLTAKNMPVTKELSVTKFLTDDAEIGEWNIQGLPTDDLSIQNGILVTRASRWPLMVDPQGQGLSWIKNRESANMLVVTSFNDKFFRNYLEDCLSFGKPMLVENIEEEIDPVLDPVLEKAIVRSGKGWKIALADKEIDYTDTFRMFLTTKLPNPHYTPETSAKVTVIDFTVTMKGLEDQLLGRVVLKEKPELQEQRQKLLEEVNSYQKKIKELEVDLLLRLSSSEGNLLDDTSLIDVLAATKKTAKEVTFR